MTLFADTTGTASADTTSVIEEELSLEEELELIDTDLLVSEEVEKKLDVVDSTETAATDSITTDSTEIKRSGPSSGTSTFTSKTARKKDTDSTAVEDTLQSEEEFSLSDIEIDNAGEVDLYKSMTEYRSPRRAMLYSLAVPGWGQAYTKKTWKSVLFGALEVGFIVGAIKFKKDGEDKVEDAHRLADNYFEIDSLTTRYDRTRSSYYNKFSGHEQLGSVAKADSNLMAIISNSTYSTMDAYVTEMGNHDSFYDRDFGVGSNTATLGWVDNPYSAGIVTTVSDENPQVTSVDLGTSLLQYQYNDMLRTADEYASYKQAFIVGIFTNHVASAIDAFITARRYNRRLMAMKSNTAYRERIIDNIHLDNDLAFDINSGVVTKVGLRWNF